MKIHPKSLLSNVPSLRLEQLLELYSPRCEDDDGNTYRDPSQGVISREDFLALLDMPIGHAS